PQGSCPSSVVTVRVGRSISTPRWVRTDADATTRAIASVPTVRTGEHGGRRVVVRLFGSPPILLQGRSLPRRGALAQIGPSTPSLCCSVPTTTGPASNCRPAQCATPAGGYQDCG